MQIAARRVILRTGHFALILLATSAWAATPLGGNCVKDGDTITVTGRTSSSRTSFLLTKPLCVRSSQIDDHVDSLTTVGQELPAGLEMLVSGRLHKSVIEIGFEIQIISAKDVNSEAKLLYQSEHGSDEFSTCLQWQVDESIVMNERSNGGAVSPTYKPRCGLRVTHVQSGALLEEWMPERGDGYATAEKTLAAALAERPSPTERFDECTGWQALALDALARSSYPAYPNSIERYFSPRCGVRLSNNDTREHVYLWLPEFLSPTTSSSYNEKYGCAVQPGQGGRDGYTFTPCVVLDMGVPMLGSTLTSIKTIPSGAFLIIDGKIVGETPVILILQQPGSLRQTFLVYVKKEGFEEGTVPVQNGSVMQVQLTRKSQ